MSTDVDKMRLQPHKWLFETILDRLKRLECVVFAVVNDHFDRISWLFLALFLRSYFYVFISFYSSKTLKFEFITNLSEYFDYNCFDRLIRSKIEFNNTFYLLKSHVLNTFIIFSFLFLYFCRLNDLNSWLTKNFI